MLQALVPGYHVQGPELVSILNPFMVLPQTLFPIIVSVYGTALWSIWKLYLGVVFDGKPFHLVALNEHFYSLICEHVKMLYTVSRKKKKLGSFRKVWGKSQCIDIQDSVILINLHM